MAHTLLFSGYGAPGCDDLAVCRLTADGTLETLSTLRHGRAPSFCCRGQNGWIYAASERGDGADVTAYVLDGTTLREIARIEIPTGRGLCHLYACGDVIYGSGFENGLYFAVNSALTRILWQFSPQGPTPTGCSLWGTRYSWRIWATAACTALRWKIICPPAA